MLERDLGNRRIDKYGNVIYRGDKLYELLYQGKGIDVEVDNSPDIEMFNSIMTEYGLSAKKISTYTKPTMDFISYHEEQQKYWQMPIGYLELDIYEYFSNKITTEEEMLRVSEELSLFEKYDCTNVLRFLIYLVDTMIENKIVWGVGRGSSVASYCLYLIGIHKVNSLKYGLEPKEFFKESKV